MAESFDATFSTPLIPLTSPIQLPLYEENDPGGDNPSAPTEPTSQSPTPEPATPAPSAAASATSTAPGSAPTTQVPEGYIHQKDLRNRFDEVRQRAVAEAQAQWNQQQAQIQHELEQTRRQLHAVLGVGPQEDPQIAEVRAQFKQLFPELTELQARAKDLLALADNGGTLTQSQQQLERHYWGEYGQRALDRLYSKVESSFGNPLNDSMKETLHRTFAGYVASDPRLAERYARDLSVVDEFVEMFDKNFFSPLRRTSTAQVETRTAPRAIPRDTPGGGPQASKAPEMKNLDERGKVAWAKYMSGKQ